VWNYWIDRDQHSIHEEYVSDEVYQDSEEDLPFGFQLTYERGGPQYTIEEPYLALWHRDKAIELLDESYEALVDFATEDSSNADTAVGEVGFD